MERLKAPKDVLGLGKHLVRELDFDDGDDTLGRWMAHHAAELIDVAENGSSVASRSKARKEATEIIIKLWEHRASLPGKAYPLAPYKDILKVLDLLQPTKNPFPFFNRYGASKKDELAANLFDSLARLIMTLLFMKVRPNEIYFEVNEAAIEALDDAELQIWTAIVQWGELFQLTGDTSVRRKFKKKEKLDPPQVNLDEAAIRLIESISTTLAELRSELKAKN